MTTDFTKGNPAKLMFFFAIPYMIGTLFQQFYNMADTVIVGRLLGMNALAAVGATGALSNIVINSIAGLTTGFAAYTSQLFGAGDCEGCRKSFGASIILSAVFTVLIMLISIPGAMPVLRLLNTPEEVIQDSYNYIIIIFYGIFSTTIFNLLSNMIRALGDSKTPLIFLMVACVINIILDIVFIKSFGMGPEGAAVATVIAQVVSDILCVIHIKKLPQLSISRRHLKPAKMLVRNLLKIGVPMTFLNIVISLGSVIISFANNRLGTMYVAACSTADKIVLFVLYPIMAFGTAASVFAAQNYGAQKYDRIKKGVNQCIPMSLAFSTVITVVMVIFGKKFMYMIAGGESRELIDNGYMYLVINSVLSVLLTPLVVYKCTLQSLGRTVFPVVSGFVEVGCRAAGALVLAKYFGFFGICFANPLAWLGALLPLGIDYAVFSRKLDKLQLQK